MYVVYNFFFFYSHSYPLSSYSFSSFSSIFISIQKSHHLKYPTHAFIHLFIHSYSFCINYFCHPSKGIYLLSFFSLSLFLTSTSYSLVCIELFVLFFRFFRRVKLLISKYIFLLILILLFILPVLFFWLHPH